jgi:demethylmenaquinone methyltransferase/2-methoxy-6-polyprenyl-1,4-benzoquinol methylase
MVAMRGEDGRRGAVDRQGFVTRIFDGIAPRYDRMNLLMTAGLWRRWQRAFVHLAAIPAGARVLDVGCGTAELSLILARVVGPRGCVVGVDLAERMLQVGRAKVAAAGAAGRVTLLRGDALDLPFNDGSFDAVASSFVLRNLPSLDRGLAEMARVVRPGGRLAVLELSQPVGLWRRPMLFYFRRVLPRLGGWAREAYEWLPRSLEGFPDAAALQARLDAAGWTGVRFVRLTGGMVALHTAERGTGAAAADRVPARDVATRGAGGGI